MKVIILAGGFGTRLSEYTDIIPKPMVKVGGRPILWHIMKSYAKFGHKNFYLALGYKSEIIKEYFLNYRSLNSDITVDLSSGDLIFHENDEIDWKVTLVETGLKTMTGGRVKRLESYIGKETFMLTYGDGVSNINLNALEDFHKSHGKIVTMTAVRPAARFGDLEFDGNKILNFQEKPQLKEGWINGGFFVCDSKVFQFIKNDNEMFEREPLDRILKAGELMAHKHNGFWFCMDNLRDKNVLENLVKFKKAPWLKK